MKRELNLAEGPDAFRRFGDFVSRILSVPRAVVLRREAEYKKEAALNPRKRGPKKKDVSRVPDAS